MAFRADEAAADGIRRTAEYLVRRSIYDGEQEYERAREVFEDLVDELGPPIDRYPTWHPLVANQKPRDIEFAPTDRVGFKGLDHTRAFAHGFITCPYNDGQRVIDSVEQFPWHPLATITARRLDTRFYNEGCTPIVVKCDWREPISMNDTVPLKLIMPLLLEKELPNWRHAEVAETWDTMRVHFLGEPSGRLSSLFVSRQSGQAIKKIWNSLIYTGMFGDIKVT